MCGGGGGAGGGHGAAEGRGWMGGGGEAGGGQTPHLQAGRLIWPWCGTQEE